MINLLKKDFIVSIKGEGKSSLKYILLFIAAYFFMNSASYFLMPIFVSYLMLGNTFYNDYKDNNINFINSVPTKKEDIVYSKYILALILIISTIVVFGLINTGLSRYYYRETVLNDIYFALNIFLIIVSVVLPLYFKFGYHKVRTGAGILAVIIFISNFSILQNIADREYYVRHPEIGYSVSMYGPFKKFFEYIAMEMDVTYINLQNLTILSGVIFVISMIISLKIMKGKSIDIKVIGIILITIVAFVFSSKYIFKDLIDEQESKGFLHGYDNRAEVNLDKVYESEDGLKVKIKFKNNTKYTYRIDEPKIQFYQKIDGEENTSMPSQVNIVCEYPFDDSDENYSIYHDGIAPFSEDYIVFTIPKGFNVDAKYFNLNETVIDYSGQYTSGIPFLSGGYITINSNGGASTQIGNIFKELTR